MTGLRTAMVGLAFCWLCWAEERRVFDCAVCEDLCTHGLALDGLFSRGKVVTNDARGARCAVAADVDRDGDMDIVTASSTDNTVAWYEQNDDGSFSKKQQVTFKSNGARIATTGDIDGDGWIDIIAASYYDHTVGWFRNVPVSESNSSGGRMFEAERFVITQSALNAQGVTVADLDGDGDLDVASASSGDNTIAWYRNLGFDGTFCDIKTIVDDGAIGARTVVAADLDGDGDVDLASASKDDDTVAWYRNEDGRGSFSRKIVISSVAKGAYSLYPVDLDGDGDVDLVGAETGTVESQNKDGAISFFRNDGAGGFSRLIIDQGQFVLSVFAADFDRDGCVDVASAEFFGDRIGWYRNIGPNCDGTRWSNETIYLGLGAHYVFGEDMDGDGDTDIIAVTNKEDQVALFYANTSCDDGPSASCCRTGQLWMGSRCQACPQGRYGQGEGAQAACLACPMACEIPGFDAVPPSCAGITVCKAAIMSDVLACDCGPNMYKDSRDVCVPCAVGQEKAAGAPRAVTDVLWVKDENTESTDDVLLAPWDGFSQERCMAARGVDEVSTALMIVAGVLGFVVLAIMGVKAVKHYRDLLRRKRLHQEQVRARILEASMSTTRLSFNMCFIGFPDFESAGRLIPHEEARDMGKLVMIDLYDELITFSHTVATMFISHQWVGFDEPDPDNVHFPAICKSVDTVCAQFDIDPGHIHLWVDYTSIPQKNVSLKNLSISSLAVYASVARFFVVIAPTCRHHNKNEICNQDTYKRRGWCRLEQWARMVIEGPENMFVFQPREESPSREDSLVPLDEKQEWRRASMCVFDGDFTVESDKEKLVDTVMGLWAQAKTIQKLAGPRMSSAQTARSSLLSESLDFVETHRRSIFPPAYFNEDMINQLEEMVNRGCLKDFQSRVVMRRSLSECYEEAVAERAVTIWGQSTGESPTLSDTVASEEERDVMPI